jgi:hypothetical protein
MGGQGSGRRKKGSAERSREDKGTKESAGVKKKSKSQPIYNGPPPYLLDKNRTDPFADPRNIIQDKDGTNRPITCGRNPNSSAQSLSASGSSAEVEPYIYGIPPTESRSEHEARQAASNLLAVARQDQSSPGQQDQGLSGPPSNSEETNVHKAFRPPPSRNTPSKRDSKSLATAFKQGSIRLGLEQSLTLARRRQTSDSSLPAESAAFGQVTRNTNEPQRNQILCPPQSDNSNPSRQNNYTESGRPNSKESGSPSHRVVPSPTHHRNGSAILSPQQQVQTGRNRHIGSSSLRQVVNTGQDHSQHAPPTRSNSRLSQVFSRSNSNGTTSNNTTSLESDSRGIFDSGLRESSTPEEKTNRAGFPTKGGLRLSRGSSQWGSDDAQDSDISPQENDTTPVQPANPRRTSEDDDIIRSQSGKFLASSPEVENTTTNCVQQNRLGSPFEPNQTLGPRGEKQNTQRSVKSLPIGDSRNRGSSVASGRVSPSLGRRYNARMSDDHSENDMPQGVHQDTFDDPDSDQYHSDVYVESEQEYEPGHPWPPPSTSAVPQAARLSSVRAQSSSSAGTLGSNASRTA